MYINQLSTMQTVLSPAVRSKLLMCHTGHGIAAEAVFHWFILHGPLFLPTMIRLSKTSREVSEVCSAYCDVTIKLSSAGISLPNEVCGENTNREFCVWQDVAIKEAMGELATRDPFLCYLKAQQRGTGPGASSSY